jgi:outer membrane protein OmpA-like peptidoglycan-associated protein
MYSEDDKDNDQRFVLGLLAGIVTLLVGSVITFGAYVGSGGGSDAAKAGASNAAGAAATASAAHGAAGASNETGTATGDATATAAAGAATGATAGADEAKVVVENGVVKFYFASGKADIAKGGNEALAEVVKGVKAGQKAVISGYHDSTGNLAQNQELAKKRAFSVRDALVALGVSAEQIELKKPEQSAGTGDNAEARRVEVVLTK